MKISFEWTWPKVWIEGNVYTDDEFSKESPTVRCKLSVWQYLVAWKFGWLDKEKNSK